MLGSHRYEKCILRIVGTKFVYLTIFRYKIRIFGLKNKSLKDKIVTKVKLAAKGK